MRTHSPSHPQRKGNQHYLSVIAIILAAIIPFIEALRAAVAKAPNPNQALLDQLDRNLAECRELAAALAELRAAAPAPRPARAIPPANPRARPRQRRAIPRTTHIPAPWQTLEL